jgi:hypothetical protein
MCGYMASCELYVVLVATRSPSNAVGYIKMMDLGLIPFEGIMIYSLLHLVTMWIYGIF